MYWSAAARSLSTSAASGLSMMLDAIRSTIRERSSIIEGAEPLGRGERGPRAVERAADAIGRLGADRLGQELGRLDAVGQAVLDPDRVDALGDERRRVALGDERPVREQRHAARAGGGEVAGEAHAGRARDGGQSHRGRSAGVEEW